MQLTRQLPAVACLVLALVFVFSVGCRGKTGPATPSTDNQPSIQSDLPEGQEGIMTDER